mmetsp:Transcript_83601/g.270173  ORF Transcript_83601/g.270173 Transcript_83601/m.270173 type:complete len:333 (-) Transcript_83601:853-1851(-)
MPKARCARAFSPGKCSADACGAAVYTASICLEISSQLRDSHSRSNAHSSASAVLRQCHTRRSATSAAPSSNRSRAGRVSLSSQSTTSATSSAIGSHSDNQRVTWSCKRARYSPRTPSMALHMALGCCCSDCAKASNADSGPSLVALWLTSPGALSVDHRPCVAKASPLHIVLPSMRVPDSFATDWNHDSNFRSSSAESTSNLSTAMGAALKSGMMLRPLLRALAGGVRPRVFDLLRVIGDEVIERTEEVVDIESSSLNTSSQGPISTFAATSCPVSSNSNQRRAASGLSARRRQTRKPKSSSSSLGCPRASTMLLARRTSKERFAAAPGSPW